MTEETDARTPEDFLFTYRGFLIDATKVEEKYHELLHAMSTRSKSELTEKFIEACGKRKAAHALSYSQNDAFNAFLENRSFYPILPVKPQSPEVVPGSVEPPEGASGSHEQSPRAPTHEDLQMIYAEMFAGDDVNNGSEFAAFEIAAHEAAKAFAKIEEQFKRLYRQARKGTEQTFHLTPEQKEGIMQMTSDRYRPISPFEVLSSVY